MHSLDGKNVFMINIFEGVAQEESSAQSENIKLGIIQKVENGNSKIYSRKCYGYLQDEDGNLTIQDSEADIVKMIFDCMTNTLV